ncbi:sialate O-acetylesterase [Paraglaciecola polaris]|uniref:sialate O-acetylesterase n=1 Tax=Paraglaciecola polaris TaxID=222814 RepID=UPI0030EB15DC
MGHTIFIGCIFLTSSIHAHALTLSPLFSDHMVLQRDKPVRIWGEGQANQQVTVSLLDKHYRTDVGADGQWQVNLPAHAKAGPFTLTVSADDIKTINDVYFGEVWIASGQSNMEWKLKGDVVGNEKEIASAHHPLIRFFDVPDTLAATKQTHLPPSHWQLASPDSVGYFSAVAWFFARKLQAQEQVAVGIIESNWGGTPAESWIDIETVAKTAGYEAQSAKVKVRHDWPEVLAANTKQIEQKWQRINDLQGALSVGAANIEYDDSSWQTIDLPNKSPLHHFVWLRRDFTLPALPTSPIMLSFGDIVQNVFIFVNGQHIATENWEDSSSIHQIPLDLLKKGNNIIVLRVNSDWDNQVLVGKNNKIWLSINGKKTDIAQHWRMSNNIEPPMPKVMNYTFTPSFLYNAMIYPLLPYTAQGVIWYQGESNVNKQVYYHTLFSNLISNWRDQAQAPDMPFIFVQLAAYLPQQDLQPDSAWAYLRDAQRQTLDVPHTGMAVAIDVGEADNVHPKQKRQVGERLWRQAASKVYGLPIIPSGPDFTRLDVKAHQGIVHFNQGSKLSTVDNQTLQGFIIAGQDKVFRVAQAHIEGETVVVSHPEISQPVAVRYAWADNPRANLINSEKLPAVPFRSDTWAAEQVSAK